MCNLYTPSSRERINPRFSVSVPDKPYLAYVAPLKQGPYIKADGAAEVGQWGMIPPHCKTRRPAQNNGKPLQTNNARRERMAKAMTFGGPWAMGQRCLIPAESFIEPYWGPNQDKSVAWQFARADGEPWALAGLWAEWTDPGTGEIVPSYTLLTQCCDGHPLLRLMHKPDPKFDQDHQDKRAVVPIERDSWDQWLHGSNAQAEALIQLPSLDVFTHGPRDPGIRINLPV